jgi:protease-4
VLRVDSPGGSQFASEHIRRELALARDDGLPVVVSMSSVAASGGYWIALAADEVWASPSTVTGSIGIFGMFPTFERTLGKVGITSDGVGTTAFSDALRLDRPMRDEVRKLFQLSIEHGYREFVAKVAEARGMEPAAVDRLARGRVWIGARAKELGLVDQLGGLQDAIAAAAIRAELEPDDYQVEWVERELTLGERLLIDAFGEGGGGRGGRGLAPPPRGCGSALVREVGRELDRLASFNDPAGRYAYCFCEPR